MINLYLLYQIRVYQIYLTLNFFGSKSQVMVFIIKFQPQTLAFRMLQLSFR